MPKIRFCHLGVKLATLDACGLGFVYRIQLLGYQVYINRIWCYKGSILMLLDAAKRGGQTDEITGVD